MPRRKTKKKSPDGSMAVSEHLRELRNRVAVVVILLAAALIAGLKAAPLLIDFLLEIGERYNYSYIYVSPQELLMQYFSVALVIAVVVTLPMAAYQIWAFMRPGLRKSENTFFILAMIFGTICFCGGVYFAYRIMLPFMLYFLISLSLGTQIAASITVQNYIGFLTTIFLIFGVVFELPVVSVLLTQMGLLKAKWMRKATKVMIVVIFFIAAVITPPDIVSQIMVALPMILLYELSILLCTICQKLKDKKKKTQEHVNEQP